MKFDRVFMGTKVVVATAIVIALARSSDLFGPWTDWQARRTIKAAHEADDHISELERQAQNEPRLVPVLSPARASVEIRRRALALEASELAFEGARERFEESRRQASEGQALVDSAVGLFREPAGLLTSTD